ncbi:MAG: hypothetical protein IAE78_01725 [Myxococcus sp.]|nr:hypothetical protein [Myxococcus sp.]
MVHLSFMIEGRGDTQHTAEEIKALHLRGEVTPHTRLSRDGRQWFAAVQLLNRLPEEKVAPPTPVLMR